MVFKKLCVKVESNFIGVYEASYKNDDTLLAREIIILANKKTKDVSPIYWKSGVIKRVCVSPKAMETRALMKLVDDATNQANRDHI